MNRLAQILPPTHVQLDVDVSSKKRAFEYAGLLFENSLGLNRALITDNLFARERLGSTGLGQGVAIPHGRIKGLKQPSAAVIRLVSPSPSRRRTICRCHCWWCCWCPKARMPSTSNFCRPSQKCSPIPICANNS